MQLQTHEDLRPRTSSFRERGNSTTMDPIARAALEASVGLISPDLRFVLSERDVPEALQAKLSDAGYRTIGLFVAMVDSKTTLRATLISDFDLDPAAQGLAAPEIILRRVNCAKMVDAWDACSRRQDENDRLQATQRASRMPMTMAGSSHIILRQRYENDYGRTKDCSYPCHAMVERRLEELEQGEVVAEALTDAVSVEEAEIEITGAMLDKDGALRVQKVTKKVPLPVSSEELRNRVRMIGISYQLASYKHHSRKWLTQMTPAVWASHLDYVLGNEVYGLKVSVMDTTIEAPWTVVLAYEHSLRKAACRMMMWDNVTMSDALEAARKDTHTKEIYFTTPVTMAASLPKRHEKLKPWAPPPPPGQGKRARARAEAKAKGKGKGKPTTPKYPHTKTPDGRLICFRFQESHCVAGKKCRFVHVCARCFAAHPMSECKAADTGIQE